jgi:GT2 family glycosyltransferase
MIVIVIVNWSGARDTIACLESLLRLDRSDFSVVVCDNGSTDGSIELMVDWAEGRLEADRSSLAWSHLPRERRRTTFGYAVLTRDDLANRTFAPLPFLTIVDIGRNLGFAAANNIGIRFALTDPGMRYFWLLNNDTVVSPQALSAMIHYCESDPSIGLCGATLLYLDRPNIVQTLGGIYNRKTGRGRGIALETNVADLPARELVEAEMDYVVGASMLVSRPFLENVGLMAEDYFLYYEEMDWAARNHGRFRQAYARDAIIFHREGATIGTKALGRSSDTALYYLVRNALLYTARNDVAMLPFVFARICLDTYRSIRHGDITGVRILVAATIDFLLRNNGAGVRAPLHRVDANANRRLP